MANDVEIAIGTTYDGGGVQSAARDLSSFGNTAEKSSFGMNALAVATGEFLYDAAKQLPAMLWEGTKAVIDMGANAQETAGLIDNSLGPAAEGFRAELERIAETTNRSSNSLEQGSSSILAMSRSMGFAQEEAAGFTAQMAGIAVDLGSFFNQDESQVFLDLQSAMAGSAETMQKYGIDVSVTALETAALNMGLIEQGEKMDRVTRATVLQAEIMRQGADAMGDAARTSDSYTNQMRGLQAVISDTAAELGKELIPAITPAVAAFADFARDVAPDVIEGFANIVNTAQNTIIVFGDLQTQVTDFFDAVSHATGGEGIDWGAELTAALNIATVGQYENLVNIKDAVNEYGTELRETEQAAKEYMLTQQSSIGSSSEMASQYTELNQAVEETTKLLPNAGRAVQENSQYYEDEARAQQYATEAAKAHQRAIQDEKAALEEQAKAHQLVIAAQGAALQASESLFDNLYQAQQDAAAAQGEYVQVWHDSATEISEVSSQLAGDLDADQKKAFNEILSTVEEGSSEWLSAYNALQNDLTDSQRAALIAQKADLEGQEGVWQTIYTGDAKAAEEAAAAEIAALEAIAQSYKTTAFEAIVASNGFNESTAQLAVNLGVMTEEEAAGRLQFVETTTAVQELTSNIQFLNDTATDQAEAIQLMSLGYTTSTEEAMALADVIGGDISNALLESTTLTREQVELFDLLSGSHKADVDITVTGLELLQQAEALRRGLVESRAGSTRDQLANQDDYAETIGGAL